jgi:hypothetical protein
MKKIYDHPTFKQYKKTPINLFFLYYMKKKLDERKEKKLKNNY